MRKQISAIITIFCLIVTVTAQINQTTMRKFQRHQTASRIGGLNLSLLHLAPDGRPARKKTPVLFIHGASYPSALAFGFRMNGKSWMDVLADEGFDVYALDFLGYGESERYPEMSSAAENKSLLGTAREVTADVERAVAFVSARTKASKIHLIGHSWGATVAARYSETHADEIERLVLFAPFVERERDAEMSEKPTAAYSCLAPAQRLEQFKSGAPNKEKSVLETDVLKNWAGEWLKSDARAKKRDAQKVCFPSGWFADLYDTYNGAANYNPARMINHVLLIRGEWDDTPTFAGAEKLYKNLINASSKRYVVIDKSTHVAHLEKNRFALYAEVSSFLNENVIKR